MSGERAQERGANGTAGAGASLSVELSLSRPAVLSGIVEAEPLYALLRVRSLLPETLSPLPRSPRPPIHLALLLDASGSMHRIALAGDEREHWRQVGEARGDLKRGRVDGREGWLWSGQTLAELQARHRTPMQAALRALRRVDERLRADDGLSVIAFADRALQLAGTGSGDRNGEIQAAVALLSRGVEASGLGSGTRLADALRLAMHGAAERQTIGCRASAPGDDGPALTDSRQPTADGRGPSRLILISDGLLEDRTACGAWVERVAEAGIPFTCIGVGDQFDEEWLMWAADMTRGRFRYAPTADSLEEAVAEELARLETLAARRLALLLRPLAGSLFRDLCQVSPELSALHRLETDGDVYRFSLGDLSYGQEARFLVELSVPPLPRGRHPVLAIELGGESAAGEPLAVAAAVASVMAAVDVTNADVDPEELDMIAAAHAYRAERRAQRALRRGHLAEATRHLHDTRQLAERLGRAELVADLQAQVAAIEAGGGLAPDREKRIKAGTRRLMG